MSDSHSDSHSGNYKYAPLKHYDSIRLFRLLPLIPGTSLEFELQEFRLLYEGPTDDAVKLRINVPYSNSPKEVRTGAVIKTSKGMRDVLHTVAALVQQHDHQWVWISSICINNTDPYEMSHHIALLDAIFEKALGVVNLSADNDEPVIYAPFELGTGTNFKCNAQFLAGDEFWDIKGRYEKRMQEILFDQERVASTYTYEPLQHEDSLRVLEILPGKHDAPIRCRVLEKTPDSVVYEALSYSWGIPHFTKTVYEVNSQTILRVTTNLSLAIRRLRPPEDSRTLWIDALCIDQDNTRERSHQVKKMASIFSQAQKVLVWLGNENAQCALNDFKTISNRFRKKIAPPIELEPMFHYYNNDSDDYDDYTYRDYMIEFERAKVDANKRFQEALCRCEQAELEKFFDKEYFKRVWIVQEFVSGKDIVIYAGHDEIEYDMFAGAMEALNSHKDLLPLNGVARLTQNHHLTRISHEDHCIPTFGLVYELVRFRTSRTQGENLATRNPSQTRTLYQCCRILIDRKCKDQRDKIYAALGLAEGPTVVPDYSLSLTAIRVDLALQSLHANDFSVLHYAECEVNKSTNEKVPSFLPRLSEDSERYRPIALGGSLENAYAAGSSRPAWVKSVGSSQIGIRGTYIDEICYLDKFTDVMSALPISSGTPLKMELFNAFRNFESKHNDIIGRQCVYPRGIKLAFWRTINLGFPSHKKNVCYFERGLDFRFLPHSYRLNITKCFQNRVFFLTKLGYMGLGPNWTKVKDAVVIFDGAETPFILRQATGEDEKGYWKLIGDCYMEGWMEDGCQRDALQREDFVLC